MKKIAITTIFIGVVLFVIGSFDPFDSFNYKRDVIKGIVTTGIGSLVGFVGLGVLVLYSLRTEIPVKKISVFSILIGTVLFYVSTFDPFSWYWQTSVVIIYMVSGVLLGFIGLGLLIWSCMRDPSENAKE